MRRTEKALIAGIESADGGGFTAVASTAAQDRDGESLAVGCFVPLPPSIPVHLDHTMSAASVIGRAVPYYVGNALHIDADLASTPDAQTVRTKLAERVLNAVSVVFRPLEWDSVAGVRTCVRAELLACDVVSIPSQSDALVLSVRGYRPGHELGRRGKSGADSRDGRLRPGRGQAAPGRLPRRQPPCTPRRSCAHAAPTARLRGKTTMSTEPRQQRVFEPSSFATRHAARAASGELRPRPPRLVSLGAVSTWLEASGRSQKGQMVDIEYLYDLDNPTRRYRRMVPNGTLEPLFSTQVLDPPPEPLGAIRAEGFNSGYYPPATTDPPPVPVA